MNRFLSDARGTVDLAAVILIGLLLSTIALVGALLTEPPP